MKIYGRFEAKRAVGGSPGNLEYEATDALDGSPVILLEWTPEARAFASTAAKLATLRERLTGGEVFSHRTSLYLATADTEVGRRALRELRAEGLFVARWPSFDQVDATASRSSSGSIPADNPLRTATHRVEAATFPDSRVTTRSVTTAALPRRTRSWTQRWAIILASALIVLAIGVAAWMEWRAVERDRALAPAQHIHDQEQLRLAQEQFSREKERVQQAEAQRLRDKTQADEAIKTAAARQQGVEERLREAEAQHQRDANVAKAEKDRQQRAFDEQVRRAEQLQREKDLAVQLQREKDMADQRQRAKDLADQAKNRKSDLKRPEVAGSRHRQLCRAPTPPGGRTGRPVSPGPIDQCLPSFCD